MPPLSPEIESLLCAKDVKEFDYVESAVCDDEVDYVQVIQNIPLHKNDQNQSVIGDVNRELEDYEISLDDKLLKDTIAAVEISRKLFQENLQEISRHSQERLELVGKDMHRQLLCEQERRQLEEMSMLVQTVKN